VNPYHPIEPFPLIPKPSMAKHSMKAVGDWTGIRTSIQPYTPLHG
jgi:hypothetical protein